MPLGELCKTIFRS